MEPATDIKTMINHALELTKTVEARKLDVELAQGVLKNYKAEIEKHHAPTRLIGLVLTAEVKDPRSDYSLFYDSKKDFEVRGVYPLTFKSSHWRDTHHNNPVRVSRVALEAIDAINVDGELKNILVWRVFAVYRKKTDGEWSKQEISTIYVDSPFKTN